MHASRNVEVLVKNYVEVYIRGCISSMGDTSASLATVTSAEVSVSVWKNLHCVEMKKLTWMLTEAPQMITNSSRKTGSLLSITSRPTVDSRPSTAKLSSSCCALCSRGVGGALSFTSSTDTHGRVCAARVCSRCRVSKTVYVPSKLEKVLSKVSMTFCMRCVLDACATSASFAVLDALEVEGKVVDYSAALLKPAP